MISELPLLAFTVLTGLSAGGYLMETVYCLLTKRRCRSWAFSAACLVLLGVGMLGVLAHLGHPERFLNALANPASMIAQEAYWSIPFGCVLLVDAILLKARSSKNIAVPAIGSVLGLGLMAVTSLAYFTSYGIAGWPEVPTLFLFALGDIALGASFAIAFSNGFADECGEQDDAWREGSRIRVVYGVAAVLCLALVAAFSAEAVVFSGLAVGPWGFVASAIVAAAAALLQVAQMLGKAKASSLGWACFALVAVSVVVSRYAFYAAA